MTLCFHLDKSLKLRICNFFIVRIAFIAFFIFFVRKRGTRPFSHIAPYKTRDKVLLSLFLHLAPYKTQEKSPFITVFVGFRQEGWLKSRSVVIFACEALIVSFLIGLRRNLLFLNIFT